MFLTNWLITEWLRLCRRPLVSLSEIRGLDGIRTWMLGCPVSWSWVPQELWLTSRGRRRSCDAPSTLVYLQEKPPSQTRMIKQNSKNSAVAAPKVERELRNSLKRADSSSGSEGRWPKTRMLLNHPRLRGCFPRIQTSWFLSVEVAGRFRRPFL